jgi:hypothetical protein
VRTKRLTETEFIDIQLTNVKIAVADANNVVVRFNQLYASSTYQGKSNKELRLTRAQDGWIIVSELEL